MLGAGAARARLRSGSSTTSSRSVCSALPETRPLGEAQLDQVGAVHSQIGEPVRLRPLLLDEDAEPLDALRRAGGRRLSRQVGGAVGEQVEREPLPVAGEEPPRIDGRRLVRHLERMLAHEPDDVVAQPRRVAQPAQARGRR